MILKVVINDHCDSQTQTLSCWCYAKSSYFKSYLKGKVENISIVILNYESNWF